MQRSSCVRLAPALAAVALSQACSIYRPDGLLGPASVDDGGLDVVTLPHRSDGDGGSNEAEDAGSDENGDDADASQLPEAEPAVDAGFPDATEDVDTLIDGAGLVDAGLPFDASNTITIVASADAYVWSGGSANSNFGTGNLYIKLSTENYTRESYLKFDLSGVKTVSHAALRVVGVTGEGAWLLGIASAPDTSWGEKTLTWNNRPQHTPLPGTKSAQIGTYAYEFDVTTFVQQEMAAQHAQITLCVVSLTYSGTAAMTFASRENLAIPPALVLVP
jgi:hypothetical protein